MINFSEIELTYIFDRCKETINQLSNIDKQDDETAYHVVNLCEDTVMLANNIVDNADIIKDANTNEEYNKVIISAIYWLDGLSHWHDNNFTTAESVYEIVADEHMCSIFEKIVAKDNDEDEE